MPRIIDLTKTPIPVIHRQAGIHQQPDGDTRLDLRLPDIIPVCPRIPLPVEPAQVITRLVAAVLTELETRPLDLALIDTGHEAIDHESGCKRQILDSH